MSDIAIEVIVTLITLVGILMPLVKFRFTKEQKDSILFWAKVGVMAMEKKHEGKIGAGATKKDHVMLFLNDTLKADKYMTEEQLSLVIDAIVEEYINSQDKKGLIEPK